MEKKKGKKKDKKAGAEQPKKTISVAWLFLLLLLLAVGLAVVGYLYNIMGFKDMVTVFFINEDSRFQEAMDAVEQQRQNILVREEEILAAAADRAWSVCLSDRRFGEAEAALEGTRVKVPDEVSDEVCDVCGRQMVIKTGRFGKFLACPGFPECKNTKPIVEKMPGRCPKCGSTLLKRKSKRGFAYYGCEQGAKCGFMSWDVPTAEDCPKCGQTMFKKSGRGRNKPFCINEQCENFLPEDKRGYYKKPTETEGEEKKTAKKETKSAKKPAAKTAKKTGGKKA